MPPTNPSDPQSALQYLTKLLAALSKQLGGEVRIKAEAISAIEMVPDKQALFEDFDEKTNEIVLRFASRHAGVYPVLSERAVTSEKEKVNRQVVQEVTEVKERSRPPLTDGELARRENIQLKLALAKMLRREGQRIKKESEGLPPELS